MDSSFIYIVDNALTKSFCEHCIDKFEKDDLKYQGVIGTDSRIDKSIKDSIDLGISSLKYWKSEDKIFFNSLQRHLPIYKYKSDWSFHKDVFCDLNLEDSGYQIQKTPPGGGYTWHHDHHVLDDCRFRVITFIWYLNDIDEDGYTEFIDGTKVQPKQGKILMFPSTWSYIHRGYPPKNQTKYIVTGWLYTSIL